MLANEFGCSCRRIESAQGLGCEMDERRCRCLLSAYDLDSSGKLETEEFVTWMMLEYVKVRGGRGGEGSDNKELGGLSRPWA